MAEINSVASSEALLRIIIPASNEANRIAPTIINYCRFFGGSAKIVVVANGCMDGTERIAGELQREFSNLAIVSINGRIGKGGAVRVGLSSGSEPYVGYTDADGSTDAAEFFKLFSTLKAQPESDGVMGCRWHPKSIVVNPQPAARRIASRAFNTLVRAMFGMRYRDTQCGAKIFRRSAVNEVLASLELSNFAFDIDLLHQLAIKRCKVIEVPIRWNEGFDGSQVRLVQASISMFLALLRLYFRDSILERLPFFDLLARKSVIPVRERAAILILSAKNERQHIGSLAHNLQNRGHDVRVIDAGETDLLGRCRFFLWYAFFGRNEYEAIVEQEAAMPFVITALSRKPAFVLERGGFRSSWIRRLYQDVPRLTSSDVSSDAEQIVSAIRRRNVYGAQFYRSGDDWSLEFVDLATGSTKHERL